MDFRLKSPYITETEEIGPCILWITNRKPCEPVRSLSVPMTLSDLERRDARGLIFPADLCTYAATAIKIPQRRD